MGFNKIKKAKEEEAKTKDVEEVPKPDETEKEDKEEEKHRFVVVKELPVQVIRESVAEDGTIMHYITTEEALTEVMNQ